MSSRALSLLALALFLPLGVQAQGPSQEVKVKAAAVNVRQAASPTAPVLFTAKAGDTFHLVSTEGDWIQVETTDGRHGYIFHTLVDVVAAAPVSSAPVPTPKPSIVASSGGGPTIDHKPLECIIAEHYPKLDAGLSGTPVARARVYFKAGGTIHWYYVDMALEGDRYVGILPKPKKETQKIDYYVDGLGTDSAEGRTQDYTPDVVADKKQCEKKIMAAMTSASKLVVGAEPGAPPVPEGFDPAGIVGATATTAAVVAASGSHTALLVAGGAVVVGGVALAVKGGGSPTPPPCVPSGFVFAIDYGLTGNVSCSTSNSVDQTYTITNNTCATLTVQSLSLSVSFSGDSQCVNNPGNQPSTITLALNGTTTIPAGEKATIRTSPVGAFQGRTFCCTGGAGCGNNFSPCTVNESFTVTTSSGKQTLTNGIHVAGGRCPACSLPHPDTVGETCFEGVQVH
jgi:uncharacterized protein YgiM (DUF1202 family)